MRRLTFFTFSVGANEAFHPYSGLRLLLMFSILPLCQFFGAVADNALRLPGNGKGLLVHAGQWAIFIAPPLIVLFLAIAMRNLIHIVKNLAKFSQTESVPPDLSALVHRLSRLLLCRTKHVALLVLLSLLGALVAVRNFIQTSDPFRYYGNDIFDSAYHKWGFLFTRINNCLLYVLVFPVLLFAAISLTWALNRLLGAMARDRNTCIDFFNPDNCGGFSAFGRINVCIMCMWFAVFGVIWADFETHDRAALTLIISAVAGSAAFFAQSILGIYPIYHCLRQKKRSTLGKLHSELNAIFRDRHGFSRVEPLMYFRKVVIETSVLPYSRNARFLVNSLRLAPAVLALTRLVV